MYLHFTNILCIAIAHIIFTNIINIKQKIHKYISNIFYINVKNILI